MAMVTATASAMGAPAVAGAVVARICPRAALSSPRLIVSRAVFLSSSAASLLASPLPCCSTFPARGRRRSAGSGRGPAVVAKADSDAAEEQAGAAGVAAAAAGLVAVPVVAWSLYTLKTTGCGLPPGPGGAIGAVEGVSYLVVLGIIAWSVATKVRTGRGLPLGPFGLLGAVEGLSYLALLAILVVFGLQYLDFGYIPGPVPGEQCFG